MPSGSYSLHAGSIDSPYSAFGDWHNRRLVVSDESSLNPPERDQNEDREPHAHRGRNVKTGANHESKRGGDPDPRRGGQPANVIAFAKNGAASNETDALGHGGRNSGRIKPRGGSVSELFAKEEANKHEERRSLADQGIRADASRFGAPFSFDSDHRADEERNAKPLKNLKICQGVQTITSDRAGSSSRIEWTRP